MYSGDTIGLGSTIPEDAKRIGIHKKPQISMNCPASTEILETWIKVIDLLAPNLKGIGKVRLVRWCNCW